MNKNISLVRIFLTATVLLVGGYYIQQSSNQSVSSNNDSMSVKRAIADVPPADPGPGGGYK